MTANIERRPLVQTEKASVAAATLSHAERFRAPFSLRCGAFLIDYIVLVSIVAFGTLVARVLGGGSRLAGGTAETIGLLTALGVSILNFIFLPMWRGQTIGKWATGLRVEQVDGKELSAARALLRHVVGYPLSFFTFGLGFLVAAFSAQGRALHDLVAGTVVVRDIAQRRTTPRAR